MVNVIFDFRWFTHLLICISILLLVGFTVYITSSSWALLGLLVIPGLEIKTDDNEEDKNEDEE